MMEFKDNYFPDQLNRKLYRLILNEKNLHGLISGFCNTLVESGSYHYVLIVIYDESRNYSFHREAGFTLKSLQIIKQLRKGDIPVCSKNGINNCGILPETDNIVCKYCPNKKNNSGRKALIIRLESGHKLYGIMYLVVDERLVREKNGLSLITETSKDLGNVIANFEADKKTIVPESKSQNKINLYKTITETITDGLIITQNNRIVFINRMICEIFGLPEEEIINSEISDFIKPDSENTGTNNKGKDEQEFWIKRKDGKRKFIRYRSVVIKNNSKNKLIVITNITGKKKSEDEIEKHQEYFKQLFENSPLGILMMDSDGKIFNSNKGFEKIFQYSPGEIKGRHSRELIMPAILKKEEGSIERILKSGEKISEITLRKRKDNQIIDVERTCYPILINGKTTGLYSIYTDITERKSSEEKVNFQANILNNIGQAVIAFDLHGNLTYLNNAVETIYQWKKSELQGNSLNNILPINSSTSKFFKIIKEVLKGKTVTEEYNMRRKDGTEFPALITATPLYDVKNKLVGIACLSTDITDRKRAEQQMKLAKEKAEQSEKIKSDFLAQMSHEIRTPINVILNFINLIREEISGKLQDDLNDEFEYINKGSQRLIRTIDLILNISQIQNNSYVLNEEKINIYKDIIEQIYKGFIISAKEKSLQFSISNNMDDPTVLGDRYTLTQVFENIIDNAIKFTLKGSVKIKIYRDDRDNICVDVSDTGIGISEEYLPKMFNPFVQEDTGYTRRFDGNGLGLALVKKYVELNKATISVKSVKNKGSIFTISFPNSYK
jgi:PAS domain S-box-containing protein